MTEGTVTTIFEHLSDAAAARAVLESSIRGVRVAVEPMGQPANDDHAAAVDGPSWELTASVPAGMEETAATLLQATADVEVVTHR